MHSSDFGPALPPAGRPRPPRSQPGRPSDLQPPGHRPGGGSHWRSALTCPGTAGGGSPRFGRTQRTPLRGSLPTTSCMRWSRPSRPATPTPPRRNTSTRPPPSTCSARSTRSNRSRRHSPPRRSSPITRRSPPSAARRSRPSSPTSPVGKPAAPRGCPPSSASCCANWTTARTTRHSRRNRRTGVDGDRTPCQAARPTEEWGARRRSVPRPPLRRSHARRPRLPSAGDEERPLPPAWRSSAGPRTEAGLDRIRAARTSHGLWSQESRAFRRCIATLEAQARLWIAIASSRRRRPDVAIRQIERALSAPRRQSGAEAFDRLRYRGRGIAGSGGRGSGRGGISIGGGGAGFGSGRGSGSLGRLLGVGHASLRRSQPKRTKRRLGCHRRITKS